VADSLNGQFCNELRNFLKKYQLFIMLSALGALTMLHACSKDKEVVQVEIGYEYFPDKVGNFIIYQVDSIHYNDFTLSIDTFKFQIKEKISENFFDLSNRVTQRIERFYRKNETENWVLKDVWFSNKTNNSAEKVEENIRFVKLVFPLKKDNEWNGNRYNQLGEKTYIMSRLHEPATIGSLNFDSTLYVLQQADSNLIEKNFACEIYGKHTGLIYKKHIYLTDKDSVINFTLPLELRAKAGFDVVYRAISFGNE
jgi:hypothetical protein